MDILLETGSYPIEILWSLGTTCSNDPISYVDSVQIKTCKLSPGEYTLVCADVYGDGWNGAQVTIQGVKYCDNFDHGSEMIVQVNITCPADNFVCQNGKCLLPIFKCDGIDDCGDSSDEDIGCIGIVMI